MLQKLYKNKIIRLEGYEESEFYFIYLLIFSTIDIPFYVKVSYG